MRAIYTSKLDEMDLAVQAGKPHLPLQEQPKHDRPRAAPRRGPQGVHPGGRNRPLEKAGLPVAADCGQPLELERKVQIGAGALVLLGKLLGLLLSPWFFVVPLFVGAGLAAA